MIRRIALVLAALGAVTLLPVSAASAVTAAPAPAAVQHDGPAAHAPAPDRLDPACQQTFHARPTKGGSFSDPCAFNGGTTPNYSWSIGISFHWNCTGGCHIDAVSTTLTICHRTDDPNTRAISVDANSLNFWVTKVAFLVFNPGGADDVQLCDSLVSPFVTAKGCGSNDGRLLGTYPQVVSIMGRGRGTLYADPGSPFPDFLRIPNTASGLFDTHESYYWIGRGGVCK